MSKTDFTDLCEFISQWGLPTAHERLAKRMEASMDEIERFYQAIVPQLDAIIEFLNQFAVEKIPPEHLPLAYTALAVCEIDDPVHVWKAPTLELSADMRAWRVKENYYDYR